MAYATKELVTADFKDIEFTSTTNVKDTDVDQFIVEADALINSFVGQRYVVPVASGSGLELLKLYSRSLVAYRIKRIMEVKQDKGADANQNVVSVLLTPKQVMELLEMIKDGDLVLDGATPLTSRGAFRSGNVSNDVCPVIKKDEKQW